MNIHMFHWFWYLLGIIFAPRLTIAIALTIYGKELNIPLGAMVVVWLLAIISFGETKK